MTTFTGLLRWVAYPVVTILALFLVYTVSCLVRLMATQYYSHLGDLKSPPVPNFFWGHLQLLHDAENNNIFIRWMEQLGPIFTYRGFIGGYRLVTMDPHAIAHILSLPHEYQKPSFVRDTLASMAGEHGLLVVEGDRHRRQRKILNPAFTALQVQALAPIFYRKAVELRDIWLALIDSSPSPYLPAEMYSLPGFSTHEPFHKTLLSPATPTLPLTPPPRVSRPPVAFRRRHIAETVYSPSENSSFPLAQSRPCTPYLTSPPETCTINHPLTVRIDVLNWLGRATLDVIGIAGFGYSFNSLFDDRNILATAFAEVFSAARKFRFITVLQAWFPVLRYFRRHQRHSEKSIGIMRQIGLALIRAAHERLAVSKDALVDVDFRAEVAEDEKTAEVLHEGCMQKGRDLLSLLIKSNLTTCERERMSQDEILSQISTFMAAGHETTSSALTWTLYMLAKHPRCQDRLYAELTEVTSTTPAPETLNALPYLDMVLRESLRLHSPVSQTMRVATRDDIIPVSMQYFDAQGRSRNDIRITKGDIVSIPIQAMNKSRMVFGEDAEQFLPERWENPPDRDVLPALHTGILTFLYGGRACIGHRFALLEMKVFLFVLLRGVRFETCPGLVIEKRANVVTRPLVKSEPERGNQMPLLLSYR